ncbi:hypothetical protein H8959_016170 [Pygathrix nigripes]
MGFYTWWYVNSKGAKKKKANRRGGWLKRDSQRGRRHEFQHPGSPRVVVWGQDRPQSAPKPKTPILDLGLPPGPAHRSGKGQVPRAAYPTRPAAASRQRHARPELTWASTSRRAARGQILEREPDLMSQKQLAMKSANAPRLAHQGWKPGAEGSGRVTAPGAERGRPPPSLPVPPRQLTVPPREFKVTNERGAPEQGVNNTGVPRASGHYASTRLRFVRFFCQAACGRQTAPVFVSLVEMELAGFPHPEKSPN